VINNLRSPIAHAATWLLDGRQLIAQTVGFSAQTESAVWTVWYWSRAKVLWTYFPSCALVEFVYFVRVSVFVFLCRPDCVCLFVYNSGTGRVIISKFFWVVLGCPRDGFRCKNRGHG